MLLGNHLKALNLATFAREYEYEKGDGIGKTAPITLRYPGDDGESFRLATSKKAQPPTKSRPERKR